MAQVPYTSFYLGPYAVYTSPTGMLGQVTGIPYLGGSLHQGDYCDLTEYEASQWNIQFGTNLHQGRYRLVAVSTRATAGAGYIAYGLPVGIAVPTSVGQVAISAAGTGSGTGTVLCASSTSGGTAATANVTVSGGIITSVQLVYPGAGFTSVPTFTLSEIAAAGITTSGTVLAQMAYSANVISSLDSSSLGTGADVRGIALCTPTTTQISAGAWIVIQELGFAPLLPHTASAVAAGSVAYMAAESSGPQVTVVAATLASTQPYVGVIGYTLDIANAGYLCRVELTLPVRQG
jgi:hypothetical protein